jgi:SAM-dependent methyltransferase
MNSQYAQDTQNSYDRVAAEYAKRIYGELAGKPLDRQLLDRFAQTAQGLICDLGCGPGHVARYLHDQGATVCGIDLSPQMVEQARQLNPGIDFQQGNMLALPAADGTFGGIVAFYSLIHIAREDIPRALAELKRVLAPGGLLQVSFHIGDETVHLDDWWGESVKLDFIFFQPEEMENALHNAGFEVIEVIQRDPYPPDVEHQSRRAYLLARKPELVIPL